MKSICLVASISILAGSSFYNSNARHLFVRFTECFEKDRKAYRSELVRVLIPDPIHMSCVTQATLNQFIVIGKGIQQVEQCMP
ncbi:hypothetical protein GGI43DRAFT_411630 [Trichoderma evansii]